MKKPTTWVPIVGAVFEIVLALRLPSETPAQRRALDRRRSQWTPDRSVSRIPNATEARDASSVPNESVVDSHDPMTDEIRSLLEVRVDQAVEIARLIARRDREAYEALQNCGPRLDWAAIERLRPLLQALDHDLDLRVGAHLDVRQRERYRDLRSEGAIASVVPDAVCFAEADLVQEPEPKGQ